MSPVETAPAAGARATGAASGRAATHPADVASPGASERRASSPGGPDLPADLVACCSPIGGDEVLEEAAAERLAGVLKALAEPTRLRLVSLIASRNGDEACVCELTGPVGLSQPTVSHHLKKLVEAGLLLREQRGKWAYYRLAPGALDALRGIFPG